MEPLHAQDMITITLPDGATREYETGTTGMQIAESISKSLAKACAMIEVNGQLWDLSRAIDADASIRLIKRDDEESLEFIRHDCAGDNWPKYRRRFLLRFCPRQTIYDRRFAKNRKENVGNHSTWCEI